MVEDGLFAIVQFDNFLLLGRNQGDIPGRLLEYFLVIDVDVRERVVEQVPQDSGGL